MVKKYLVIKTEDHVSTVIDDFDQLSQAWAYVVKNGISNYYVVKIIEPKVIE